MAHERKRESKGEQPSLSVVTSEFQANNCTGTVAAETSADRQRRWSSGGDSFSGICRLITSPDSSQPTWLCHFPLSRSSVDNSAAAAVVASSANFASPFIMTAIWKWTHKETYTDKHRHKHSSTVCVYWIIYLLRNERQLAKTPIPEDSKMAARAGAAAATHSHTVDAKTAIKMSITARTQQL